MAGMEEALGMLPSASFSARSGFPTGPGTTQTFTPMASEVWGDRPDCAASLQPSTMNVHVLRRAEWLALGPSHQAPSMLAGAGGARQC